MSQTKAKILENIRRHTAAPQPQPDLKSFTSTTYEDTVAQFVKMVEAVGGKVVRLSPEESVGTVVRHLYPEATRFVSELELPNLEVKKPSETPSAIELNGTDVAIVTSPLGVCENGAVWVEQTEAQRAHFFIAENLVVVIESTRLVHTMHEGYAWVKAHTPSTPFSAFISGPSKTADIEQALVMGAHGARTLTVLLR